MLEHAPVGLADAELAFYHNGIEQWVQAKAGDFGALRLHRPVGDQSKLKSVAVEPL